MAYLTSQLCGIHSWLAACPHEVEQFKDYVYLSIKAAWVTSKHEYLPELLLVYVYTYVPFFLDGSKEKPGYMSDVPGIELTVPWENKPLIQTCN